VRIANKPVLAIANDYLARGVAWLLVIAVVAALTVLEIARRRAWHRAGFPAQPRWRGCLAVGAPAVGLVLVVSYLNRYFGVPYLLVLLLAMSAGLGWITRRTLFGRHLYAVGGNREAARRAGVPVTSIRISVLAASGLLAALGGVVSASRLYSVSASTGGGTLLLEAIAAAVIGGTSLFGGRGRIFHALLGALVIESIENGLDLLGKSAATKNIATGVILVLAVSVDALGRKRRLGSGALG
jgi:D-xylose transport system permease protein